MGVAASRSPLPSPSAHGVGGDPRGDRADDERDADTWEAPTWTAQTWQQGVPFTLLHDESFVREKYQEILRGHGVSTPWLTPGGDNDADDDALETTGGNELPMDELEQIADATRIKLFCTPSAARNTITGVGTASARRRAMSGAVQQAPASGRVDNSASALATMEGTALACVAKEYRTHMRLRDQRTEIVRDYFSRLAQRRQQLRQDVRVANGTATSRSEPGIELRLATNGDTDQAPASLLAGMFSLSSLRLQLVMLREFRTSCPSLFENGLRSVFHTVIEFPLFAFHGIDSQQSTEALLLVDLRCFCCELLAEPDLSDSHRNVLLLLLLSFGVSSGQCEFLLAFVNGLLERKEKVGEAEQSGGNDAFFESVRKLVLDMERYRMQYSLGTFKEESLLKRASIRAVKNDPVPEQDSQTGDHWVTTTVSTDSNYLYSWNIKTGLSKVGTGLNFSVAGRVYAHVQSREYLRLLRDHRGFRCGLYGSGKESSALIQSILNEDASSNGIPVRRVQELLIKEDPSVLSSDGSKCKLYVEYGFGDNTTVSPGFRLFHGDELFQLPGLTGGDICFAFYGDFELLSAAAITHLKAQMDLNETSDNGASPEEVTLTSDFLTDLVVLSGLNQTVISESKELILIYSVQGKNGLSVRNFANGDAISAYESHADAVYHSSLVFVDGFLYLSMLTPVAPKLTTIAPYGTRRLLRISPLDLGTIGWMEMDTNPLARRNPCFISSRNGRPLVTYVSEGFKIYEVEMNADLFRVRVFIPGSSDKPSVALFQHSFDLDIKQIQCATFVSCFLKILKMELCVSNSSFTLPSFVTNGYTIGMYLPSITSLLDTGDTSRQTRYDGLMFDCARGTFISVSDESAVNSLNEISLSQAKTAQVTKSFERTLPGSVMCFDAQNNLLWIINHRHGSMYAYRNPGRKVRPTEFESISYANHLSPRIIANTSEVVFRVLSFLGRCAEAFGIDSGDKHQMAKCAQLRRGTNSTPFTVQHTVTGVSTLLDIADRLTLQLTSNQADNLDVENLCACLGLLNQSVQNGGKIDNPSVELETVLKSRFPGLLRVLNEASATEEKPTSAKPIISTDAHLRIVTATVSLTASASRIFHADIGEELDRIIAYITKWKSRSLSLAETAVTKRLLAQFRTSIENMEGAAIESNCILQRFGEMLTVIASAQIERIQYLRTFKIKLADRILARLDDTVSEELIGVVNCTVQTTFARCSENISGLKSAMKIFSMLSFEILRIGECVLHELDSEDGSHAADIDKELQTGLLRNITPTLFDCLLIFMRDLAQVVPNLSRTTQPEGIVNDNNRNLKSIASETSGEIAAQVRDEIYDFLKRESTVIVSLLSLFDRLASGLGINGKSEAVETVSVTTKLETMESSHEYANRLDETTKLHIPGATRMSIVFDPRSRTEFNYDYITFYKDIGQTSFYGQQFYSGRDDELNWPGVAGNPPLVIESDHCFVYFHTDASNNDWGFKFTATGEIFEKKTSIQRHWLRSLLDVVVGVIDEISMQLIGGELFFPYAEIEAQNDSYLHKELIRHGLSTLNDQQTSVLTLLRQMINPQANSDAERVLQAIRLHCAKSRTPLVSATYSGSAGKSEINTDNPVDRAIRAATAAILHHNMWGMDAYALAQNLRPDVSELLVRGWKNAQKMRDWFHLGDAADAAHSGSTSPSRRRARSLRRQPSAFKGMTEEALRVLSQNVVDRAHFLLELTPMSFSYVSGAKRRWGLLAKYGSAVDGDTSSESPLSKWYNLLHDLQAATDLSSLLHYRRSSCERMKNGQSKSVTEQVLEFIQSDIDASELRQLIKLRNRRAESRARGFKLFNQAWNACSNACLKSILVESLSAVIQRVAAASASSAPPISATKPATGGLAISLPRLHFGTLLSGCDGVCRREVNESFGLCLMGVTRELEAQLAGDSPDATLIVGILKSIALDFEVDDAYLLQESKILTQLLRVLGSNVARVRRAAQSLLGILLSRFVIGKVGLHHLANGEEHSDSDLDDNDTNAFQKQLFATVGLQLEGIVSFLRGIRGDATHESWMHGEHFLGPGSGGLVAPVAQIGDVQWNHTIMLWIFVAANPSCYSLKLNDLVRRGPSWVDCDDDDGGAGNIGTVVEICDPTTIRVQWSTTNIIAVYKFAPNSGHVPVIHVDDNVGGVVFSKGTKTLVKDTPLAAPWSHFGLYLSDKLLLSYEIACGAEKVCVYDTNYELELSEWTHVAIVQNEGVLKLYVNGLVAAQHKLDPFLVMHANSHASESKIIESAHPSADVADQYWPIHFPGASRIRVTFDPLSEVDQSSGYVRFYKNARCNEHWGQEKYTGRYHDPERNFPGGQSNRSRSRCGFGAAGAASNALEIPSDRCLVYFHHEGDAHVWGFRILVTPEYESISFESGDGGPSLNSYPFYFGEPPARIADEPGAKCWIYRPEVLNDPLEEDDIIEAMHHSCPNTAEPTFVPNDRILHILSLFRTCSETAFGRMSIATPENIGDLIYVAFHRYASVEVRCSSVIVLKELLASLSPDVIEAQFNRVFDIHDDSLGFVQFVFAEVAELGNVWSRYSDIDSAAEEVPGAIDDTQSSQLGFHVSAQEATSLVSVYVSLLRRMVTTSPSSWLESIFDIISNAFENAERMTNVPDGANWNTIVSEVTAALVLMGGGYSGVTVNGRVRCCVNIDGKEAIETGYLVRFRLSGGTRRARVLFDCDPTRPVDVPVNDVAFLDNDDDPELADFLMELLPLGDRLCHCYSNLLKLNADLPFECIKHKPKVTRKENVEVLESEHPYAGGEDVIYPLSFHGAREIIVYFDQSSCTSSPNDYVCFLKRKNNQRITTEGTSDDVYWGDSKYFGNNFPGVGANPPLRIRAAAVDVRFRTAGPAGMVGTDWGFKLTAHAFEETLSYPPERPPSYRVNAINDIRARTLKGVHAWIRELHFHNEKSMSQCTVLLPALVAVANAASDGRPTQSSPKSQVFESKHPYANSVLEYMAVTFSGASRLIITFDPHSRTEVGSDYVCFFKDKGLTDRWGEYQYSGIENTANWPGTGGRAPLVIPSESFTLLWCTDASNVDWGWKFAVVAEYPSITPLSLRLDQLEKRAYDMWEILYEGTRPQRIPFDEEYEGFEVITSPDDALAISACNDDSRTFMRQVCELNGPKSSANNERNIPTQFRVVDKIGVTIHSNSDCESEAIGRLEYESYFVGTDQRNGWVTTLVSAPTFLRHDQGGQQRTGWIRRHTAGINHVEMQIGGNHGQVEDLIVLGIDDGFLQAPNTSLYMDSQNEEQQALASFVSQFSYESLKGQTSRLHSLAYDTHRALAIKHARESLSLYLSHSPDTAQLNMSAFGSAEELLILLVHVYDTANQPDLKQDESCLGMFLEKRLNSIFVASLADNDNDNIGSKLVEKCLDVLAFGTALLPRARGAQRIIESSHPYLDDVDQFWQIHIPGAAQIRIVFDPRSRTESGCDWVCFYKEGTNRETVHGEPQYGGRNGNENWAGCAGRPPLLIDADSVEVHFHSDSSQNDWGFKLSITGIFKSEDLPADYASGGKGNDDINAPTSQHNAPWGEAMNLIQKCCQILTIAARAQGGRAAHTAICTTVYSPATIKTIMLGLLEYPQRVKIDIFRLLTELARTPVFFHALPVHLVEELHNLLVAKLRAQYQAEEHTDSKSEYLQVIVQCALMVNVAVDSGAVPLIINHCGDNTRGTIVFSESASPEDSLHWSTIEKPTSSGIYNLEFTLAIISDVVQFDIIGLVSGDRKESQRLLHWNGKQGTIEMPRSSTHKASAPTVLHRKAHLQSGDTVTCFIDVTSETVLLRKNSHTMVDLNGPIDSLCETMKELNMSIKIRVGVSSSYDAVQQRCVAESPLAVTPGAVTPSWYNRIRDAMSLLLDFHERRALSMTMRESQHPMNRDDFKHEKGTVCVPDAVMLEIQFDKSTSLSNLQRLRFTNPQDESSKILPVGLCGRIHEENYPSLFVADQTRKVTGRQPTVGDYVVRSTSDWYYGDEDGGAGNLGCVLEVASWNGQKGCGLRIRWLSSKLEKVYRYGYEGFFDVHVFHPSHSCDTPLIIHGDQFSFEMESVEAGTSAPRLAFDEVDVFHGSLRVTPGIKPMIFDIHKSNLILGDDFTVELWVSIDDSRIYQSSQSLGPGVFTPIVRFKTYDSAISLTLCHHTDEGCLVLVTHFDEGTAIIQNRLDQQISVEMSQWVHLALVFAAATVSLHQDGNVVFEGAIDKKMMQSLYLTTIEVGGIVEENAFSPMVGASMQGHVCDLRVWDVTLRTDQILSHVNGFGAVHERELSVLRSPMSPRALHKIPRGHFSLLPPSPPRSPSRSFNIPQHSKKWVTSNRTGKELVTVRADCAVTHAAASALAGNIVYFEAHVLSSGKVCVGWVDTESAPPDKESLIGDFAGAFGLELPKRIAHFADEQTQLECPDDIPPSQSQSSRGSIGSLVFGDIYARDGDVIGCAYLPGKTEFAFFLNGQSMALAPLGAHANNKLDTASPSLHDKNQQKEYDSLVDGMLSLGFSRKISEEALDASGAASVPSAVSWLLEASSRSDLNNSVSSPRQMASMLSFSRDSPRPKRPSAASESHPFISRIDGSRSTASYSPAASLSAQGAQTVAWNFGHRPFKYRPTEFEDKTVISVLNASGRTEDEVCFQIFHNVERQWESIKYRHRVQDMTPKLVAWWKLDEGTGNRLYDCTGHDLVATIEDRNISELETGECVWDPGYRPPEAVTRCYEPVFNPLARSSSDTNSDHHNLSGKSLWGYRFYVIPHFTAESVGRRRFVPRVAQFVEGRGSLVEDRVDQQLVKYVNKVAFKKKLTMTQVLRAHWSELAPSDEELVQWPALAEAMSNTVGLNSSNGPVDSTGNRDVTAGRSKSSNSQATAAERLGKRFKMLQELNSSIHCLLPFIPFATPAALAAETESLGDRADGKSHCQLTLNRLLAEQRFRIFSVVKRHLWDDALRRTNDTGLSFELTLNRPKAMRHRMCGKQDTDGRYALFAQAFRQLNSLDGSHFRRSDAIYYVRFLGENAEDAGGPYRETFAQYAEELHSAQLPLLLMTSNALHNVGVGREKWVLNSGAARPVHLQMYEFLGKLFGVAMRSQQYLSLNIAHLIWKQLVGEKVGVDDLALIDSMIVSSMDKIRTIDRCGVTDEMFEDIVMETFTTMSSDNRVVPLKPNGEWLPVTFATRVEFADLVEKYRLHEFSTQVAAVLQGIAKVVPANLLTLFTGPEIELMVCGTPEIDVDLLQRCTEHSGCQPTDPHVIWFWNVLRGFSHDDRSAFLRFVWGRSRLPACESEFPQLFKLQSFNRQLQQSGRNLDAYLPIAHTCFFAVEVPAYSSEAVLRDKLLYAIYNCQEIDADGDSMAANQLGWEE